MKKNIRHLALMALVLVSAIAIVPVLAACTASPSASPTLSSIAVAPASPTNLQVGSTQQFTATATYSDGSTAAITSSVTWASSNTSVATINSQGLASGVAAGTTQITASMSGVTSPAVTLNVSAPAPAVSAIAVTPSAPPDLSVGFTEQFAATATYADGSTADVAGQATWVSSDPTVATVDTTGTVNGVAAGTVTITASLAGVTSPPITLNVVAYVAPSLTAISIAPASPVSLAVGSTLQFTATGTYSDGSSSDITSSVSWMSDNTGVVSIDSNGMATAVAAGTANITATLSGVTSSSTAATAY